ncbi:MAG: TetR/AcrR family transcriptional regulator, partial [Leptolyngbya sp. SIO4C1]|nr:TetR/AcrR family transcriptional regulator [Leptolyngbya sp. SIO4C1]
MSSTVSKAQATRSHILRQAAIVFNRQGFAGTSMSDLMQATGLQKGGVYNHFKSKDELALATYDAVLAELNSRYRQVLRRDR